MKRLITVSLCALSGFVFACVLFVASVSLRPAGAGAGVSNGDVNGDGDLDVSDAVYLLVHLFRGGEEPVPCAVAPELVAKVAELEASLEDCHTALVAAGVNAAELTDEVEQLQAELARCRSRSGLLDSGQDDCYDLDPVRGWVVKPCNEVTCPGQDGAYHSGCPSDGRFVDNGDGTVTDNCTGLMWQQHSADLNGDGRSPPDDVADVALWCDATNYCESLVFSGHSDWRLPNVRELLSIVDFGRAAPSIDPVFTAVNGGGGYWTSTSNIDDLGSAAYVEFELGWVSNYLNKPVHLLFVRAVRDAP